MSPTLLGVLRQLYVDGDFPADRVVSNDEVAERYRCEFAERSGHDMELPEFKQLLLNCRKKKLLPKLGRNYQGPRF